MGTLLEVMLWGQLSTLHSATVDWYCNRMGKLTGRLSETIRHRVHSKEARTSIGADTAVLQLLHCLI